MLRKLDSPVIVSLSIALSLLLVWPGWLPAQERAASDLRLEALNKRASSLAIAYADDPQRTPPELLRAPVLRCSDPTREETDGAVWLWLAGKRPVAALCILKYANGKFNYEHIALADEAVVVTGRPAWSWNPKADARTWSSVDQPVPATARARQLTLRSLARRLEASELRRGESFPLRLLDRPIYTYADEEEGIAEGAVFAMSYGTNPEVLAQIEARGSGDKLAWQVAFARMSAAQITIKLDGKQLWTAQAMQGEDPKGSYYAVNELAAEE